MSPPRAPRASSGSGRAGGSSSARASRRADATAFLVRGDDATLVAQEARALVHRLVGDEDPGLVVEEHGWAGDELDVGKVVDAITTPPFLVDRRVVVLREAGRLTAADAKRLADALAQPASSCQLVLVGGGGTVPQALVKAVGAVIDASAGTGRDRSRWLSSQLTDAPVRLSSPAQQMVAHHLGDDLGRLDQLLQTLAAAYGPGASVDAPEVEPFLGSAGAVPPWELTDAIDAGRTEASLVALERLLGPGGRAGPEVVALLHRHFDQMLRLDGPRVASPEEAASVLGVRSAFVAKKALSGLQKLGPERVAEAIVLIAESDQDVKGRSGLPPGVVLEVLVARLSRLSRGPARSGRARRLVASAARRGPANPRINPRSPGGR